MAHLQIEQRLETLGGQSIFHVVLPEAGNLHEAPVIYLLHGAGDNGTGWLLYTAAERYATEKGLVLIIPGVGNSWYTDMASGVQAFTCVTQELPAVCRRMFGLTQQREKTHVIGLSMGGYAALKLALTNPYSYTTCTALSAAVRPEQVVKSPDWPLPPAAARAVFGPGIDHGELPPQADLWQLAASAVPAALPAIRTGNSTRCCKAKASPTRLKQPPVPTPGRSGMPSSNASLIRSSHNKRLPARGA